MTAALTTTFRDAIGAIRELAGRPASIECPACGGCGYSVTIEPACCGRVNRSGECRAYCAVPEEVQEPCRLCGGSGHIDELPARNASEDTYEATR